MGKGIALSKERTLALYARVNEASSPVRLRFLQDDLPFDIASLDFKLVAKRSPNSKTALFTLTIDDGLTVETSDNNELEIIISEERATDRIAEANFYQLISVTEGLTWLSGPLIWHNGEFDGVETEDTLTVTDGSNALVEITITSGGNSGGGGTWGSITGTLANQTDLQSALDGKWSLASGGALTANNTVNIGAHTLNFVGTGGIYIGDSSGNDPAIFSATVAGAGAVGGLIVAYNYVSEYQGAAGLLVQGNATIGGATLKQISSDGSEEAYFTFDMDNYFGYGAGIYFKDVRAVKKGIEYLADYSADYTSRSLVDKGYITSYAWSLSGTSTLTGSTTINGNSNDLLIQTRSILSNSAYIRWTTATDLRTVVIKSLASAANSGTITTATDSGTNEVTLTIITKVSSSDKGFDLSSSVNGISVADAVNTTGFGYAADYSTNGIANYGNRWVPDVGYVASGSITFTNKSGNISQWTNDSGYLTSLSGAWSLASGGALTGDNSITGAYTIDFATKGVSITQTSQSSGWTKTLTVTPGTHTSLTAATEFISRDFAGATWTWIDGTVATQRFNWFRAFTVSKTTSAATFTHAYAVYIDRTTAGVGVTITNNHNVGLGFIGYTGYIGGDSTGMYMGHNSNSVNFALGTGTGSVIARDQLVLLPLTKNVSIGSTSDIARLYVLQTALSSSWKPTLRVDPGAHTAQLTTVEYPNFVFESATQTGASGTVASQRNFWIKTVTYAGTSGTRTATDAYGLYVEAYTVGANAAIPNNWAIGCAGNLKVTGSRVNMASLPTSAAGLATGDIWNNSGVINIV